MQKETVHQALKASGHILATNDAVVTEITKLITNYEQGKRPYYIYCAATGAKLGMSQQPVFEKRLQAFNGNILDMFASYKGRSSSPKAETYVSVKTKKAVRVHTTPKEPIKSGISHIVETTKTDADGNPTEQAWLVFDGGKLIKRELKKVDEYV